MTEFMTKGRSTWGSGFAWVLTALAAIFLAGSAAAHNLRLETEPGSARRPSNVDIMAGGGIGLNLAKGVTNNYVSDNASLSMVNGARPNLNFNAADFVVRGPVLRSAAQAAYGLSNSASQRRQMFEEFLATQEALTLIPEPSTWVMTIMGASLLLSLQRFRKKKD